MDTVVSRQVARTLERLTLDHIDDQTPIGAHLLPSGNGATFKVWAPEAREIELLWQHQQEQDTTWNPGKRVRLKPIADGFWAGFVPWLKSGDRYMLYVHGPKGGGGDWRLMRGLS